MGQVRNLAKTQWGLAALVLLLALGVRLTVPAGFMPMREGHAVVLALCSGHGPMMLGHHGHGMADDHNDQPCGFGALSLAATAGADPIQLATAIDYIEAHLPVAIVAAPVHLPARLRPPLRAPPA